MTLQDKEASTAECLSPSFGHTLSGDEQLCEEPATGLAALLRGGEVSAREAVEAHLRRVERCNPGLNAIVTLTADAALAAASAADEALVHRGPLGALHGLPVAHKDLQDTAGVRTTYGSPIYADHVPAVSSPLVTRMAAAGAVSLGKTNTPEFGAGSHTYNDVFGPTRNPWDRGRSAGGSSGGAAAALAAGMVCLADGSDMGGSLRNPSSFCNVVGLRPSPSLLPGVAATRGGAELSVEGPMGRNVADVALLLEVLTEGRVHAPVPEPPGDLAGKRVAWCPAPAGVPVDRSVRDALAGAPGLLAGLGAEVVEGCPDLDGAEEAFRVLRAWQFAMDLGGEYREHRSQLNADVSWNIEAGLQLSGADVARAWALRRQVIRRAAAWMDRFDALVLPVVQVVPFPVGLRWPAEVDGSPTATYLDWMRSCYLISATALPALSVPFGFTPDGLPVGLQLVGRPGGDAELLVLAAAVEEAAGAGRRRPAVVEAPC
ncbi:MAG: amidase [Acidimicrobiales bacterium]